MLTGDQARCLAGVETAGTRREDRTEEASDAGKDSGRERLGKNKFVALIGQGAMAMRACADEAAGSAVRVGGHEVVRGRQAQARIVERSSAKFTGEMPGSHFHRHCAEADRPEEYPGSSTRGEIR
jgi:hypothetical protein